MKKIEIPKVADQLDAATAELVARRNDFGARLVKRERERLEYIQSDEPAEEATHPDATRLAVLLGAPPPPIVPDRRTRLAQFAEDIRILKSAVSVLDSQIRVAEAKARAAVLAVVSPLYRAKIRAVCDAFKQVHAANVDLRELTNALENDGVPWESLGVVAPRIVGFPTDQYSAVALYFRDAAEQGFLEKTEIPPELRQ